MIYLEITYFQKDEAKPFGVRWDPKEKLWYFPGDVPPGRVRLDWSLGRGKTAGT